MSETGEPTTRARRDPLSSHVRDEVMAEILGDVHTLHKSVSDLAAIIRTSDERLSGRIVDLLKASSDFANAREGAIAELSAQASIATQKRITETLGGLLTKVDVTLASIGGSARESNSRRLIEMCVVALASAALTGAATLVGVWTLIH